MNTLSAYAIRTRFPGIAPTESDARDAVVIARTIRRRVRRHLGL